VDTKREVGSHTGL